MTDTEWMVHNTDYARAIVCFAREKARSEGLAELLPLADRLELLVVPPMAVLPRSEIKTRVSASAESARDTDISARYIGRLR